MPLPLPDLDDHTYNDLVEKARAQIPVLNSAWTDHNPTDPGIVIIEMLAWLAEMVMFRVNRIPDINKFTFLGLLRGIDVEAEDDLEMATRETVQTLRDRYRAVTCSDFEFLATESWHNSDEIDILQDSLTDPTTAIVKRAHCIPERNMSQKADWDAQARGHVSLIVVPGIPENQPMPTQDLLNNLWNYLDNRRLLTTRHHVVRPVYVDITIEARDVHLIEGTSPDTLLNASDSLRNFFHPLKGGPDNHGWPFGRDIYVSEIYEVLDNYPGIDYVEQVILYPSDAGRLLYEGGEVVMAVLNPYELVNIADVTLQLS